MGSHSPARARPANAALADEALQGHEGVADQVLGVFKADGEADGARVDPGRAQRPVVELADGAVIRDQAQGVYGFQH